MNGVNNFPIVQYNSRIEEIFSFDLWIDGWQANDGRYSFTIFSNIQSCILTALNKIIKLKKVLGWISTDTKLSKYNKICFFGFRLAYTFFDLQNIILKISDYIIKLC